MIVGVTGNETARPDLAKGSLICTLSVDHPQNFPLPCLYCIAFCLVNLAISLFNLKTWISILADWEPIVLCHRWGFLLLPVFCPLVGHQVFSSLSICHPLPAESWTSVESHSVFYPGAGWWIKWTKGNVAVLYTHLQFRHELFTLASVRIEQRCVKPLISPF